LTALLEIYGKKKKVEGPVNGALGPTNCPRCKESNEYSNVFCKKCGWVLDKEGAVTLEKKRKDADAIITALTKDKQTLQILAQAMSELGLVPELMKIQKDVIPSLMGP